MAWCAWPAVPFPMLAVLRVSAPTWDPPWAAGTLSWCRHLFALRCVRVTDAVGLSLTRSLIWAWLFSVCLALGVEGT